MRYLFIGIALACMGAISCIIVKHNTDDKLQYVISFAVILVGGALQLCAFFSEKKKLDEVDRKYKSLFIYRR